MGANLERANFYRPELRLVTSKPVRDRDDTTSLLRRKTRETVGSDAFNLEYDSPPTPAELRRDIVSYLSEYRLQVQKHPYHLIFGRERDGRGPISLRDQDRGEPLSRKAKRAIESRTLKEQPTHREEAELAGLTLLNEQLRFSQTGDTVIWASPPGFKEEGYGDYGFLYVGKVKKSYMGTAEVAMQAIRIESPSLDQYNAAFSALTGEQTNYQYADSFLSRPTIIHQDIPESGIDAVLQQNFSFVPNDKDRKHANRIIQRMDPMIEDFLEIMQTGTRTERIRAFYALENYALELKKQESIEAKDNIIFMDTYRKAYRLNDVLDKFGHKPPVVGGSCGSSEGSASSNSLTSISGSENVAISVFGKDDLGDRAFHCPECNALNVRPYNGTVALCQSCGSDKVAC